MHKVLRKVGDWLTYIDVQGAFFSERVAEIPRFIERVSRINPSTPILDVGCTDSFMPPYYIALGFEVHGVDLRDPGFRCKGFTFLQGNAGELELPRSYDLITMLSTIEHCGFDVYGADLDITDMDVVANLRRYLTPRGRFLCSVPFGERVDLGWWRVYDADRLAKVFGQIENAVFYALTDGTWYEVALAEVEGVQTDGWPPRAIVIFEAT